MRARMRRGALSPISCFSIGMLCHSHTPRQVCYGVDLVAHPLEAEGTYADLGGIGEHFDVFRKVDKVELLPPLHYVLELRAQSLEVRHFGVREAGAIDQCGGG